MDDATLVRRLRLGDEEAFDEFFDTHFDRVFRFAMRHTGDREAAQDVAQNTLIIAVRRLETWRGEAALFTWLCAICRREVLAHWDSARHEPTAHAIDDAEELRGIMERIAADGDNPERALERRELAGLVRLTLDSLPDRYGDVLEWKYIEGRTVADIAARLRSSPKAVESMLARARQAFRDGFTESSRATRPVMKAHIVFWMLLLAGTTACSESPTAPSAFPTLGLAVVATTGAFEYRHGPNDAIEINSQEAYHRWAVDALGVTVTRRIGYNKYKDRAHMQSLTGVANVNAYANGDTYEIHTIWPRDNHEVVHLYSSAFGRPVALWSEGLAVAFQTNPSVGDFVARWSGTPLEDLARQFRASGRLIPIAQLLTTAGFRQFDANVTYPEAGSFMRFVIAKCGLEGVKRFYGTGAVNDTGESVAAQFDAACQRSLADIEQAWLTTLAAH